MFSKSCKKIISNLEFYTQTICLPSVNNKSFSGGSWVVQSVKRPTSAQVMISLFMSSGPASGSVLTAQSLEPASDSGSPSLSVPPPLMLCLSVKNKHLKKLKENISILWYPELGTIIYANIFIFYFIINLE